MPCISYGNVNVWGQDKIWAIECLLAAENAFETRSVSRPMRTFVTQKISHNIASNAGEKTNASANKDSMNLCTAVYILKSIQDAYKTL